LFLRKVGVGVNRFLSVVRVRGEESDPSTMLGMTFLERIYCLLSMCLSFRPKWRNLYHQNKVDLWRDADIGYISWQVNLELCILE
jgi:hypothetical protein